MPDKDYSATPLSQKLGAKPGAGVIVLFATSQAELERRFDGLRATLDPADGLWIAWPKKAAKIETDLTFDTVQRIGLDAGLVDNKSCAIDERWQSVEICPWPARVSASWKRAAEATAASRCSSDSV